MLTVMPWADWDTSQVRDSGENAFWAVFERRKLVFYVLIFITWPSIIFSPAAPRDTRKQFTLTESNTIKLILRTAIALLRDIHQNFFLAPLDLPVCGCIKQPYARRISPRITTSCPTPARHSGTSVESFSSIHFDMVLISSSVNDIFGLAVIVHSPRDHCLSCRSSC
ncbi:hypothetical protein VTO42DRAFT_5799 [Malbranchea cinnamomea]